MLAGHFDLPEVCLFFHNQLFRGSRASKQNCDSLDAFASPNMDPLCKVGINFDMRWDLALPSPKDPFNVRLPSSGGTHPVVYYYGGTSSSTARHTVRLFTSKGAATHPVVYILCNRRRRYVSTHTGCCYPYPPCVLPLPLRWTWFLIHGNVFIV